MPEVRERLQAALADRYTIQRELGRGGMATVYLAADIKHRRDVALKVIKPEVAHALGSERFLREIEVTGRLDHPHILPLLDSGDADGLLYYVMPYVDGESLRDRLAREKQLPLEDVLAITREVADALTPAHSRGIVHRDIKPENILLSGGHARVADFGIARAVLQADAGTLTESGLALGTPLYMSPEQSAGVKELDGRSDLYSLGCVVYEMLAGEPPYTGPTAQAILAKRMRDPVPHVTVVRAAVPESVDRALVRALANVPADRYATPLQFAAALTSSVALPSTSRPWIQRLRSRTVIGMALVALIITAASGAILWRSMNGSSPVAGDPDVIAVLPFRVTAPDSAHNYLREGVVDLLSAQLTGEGVPRAVDSRTTLSAWRRAVADAEGELTTEQSLALSRRLGAEQVLLGELVATPRNTTVSGRLLDGRNGRVIAQHSESGTADAVLLVHRLVGRLLARTMGEDASRLPALSDSLEAVKAYLAGMVAHRRSDFKSAAAHFDRALRIDSTFALAALWTVKGGARGVDDIRRRAERVWTLRDRLSARDRAFVTVHFAIGPNYPNPSTMAERFRAYEQAVRAHPDRAEDLLDWATTIFVYGPQVGRKDAIREAADLLDRAIALDSSYGPAVTWRLELALAIGDLTDIQRFSRLEEAVNPDADYLNFRWAGLRALNDSMGLERLNDRVEAVTDVEFAVWTAEGALHGLPLDDPEEWISARLASNRSTDATRRQNLRSLFYIAALRGKLSEALSWSDSAQNHFQLITVALADPGYESEADEAARFIATFADTTHEADSVCARELWRAYRGDTVDTRQSSARIRAMVRKLDPAPFPRVGRLEVCPLLLEAMLEGMAGTSRSTPALDRLEALLREGTGLELPGNLATLLVARARAAQGDYQSALEVIRRRPFIHAPVFTIMLPAHLREEGRLAALVGDTAGAIRAYRHYLTVRDQPDPGPMEEEVRLVRSHLTELLGGSLGR